MEVVAELLLLLVAARVCGEVAVRFAQPAAVGEIVAGIVVVTAWPFTFGAIDGPPPVGGGEVLHVIGMLGMFFLILQAGIEMSPAELKDVTRPGLAIAAGGMVVPLLAGLGLGYVLLPEGPMQTVQALVLGVAMAITAIPATIRILEELNILHTSPGRAIVAAALFDDVFGIVLLAVVTAMIQYGSTPTLVELAILLLKVAGFFAVTALIGTHLYERISHTMRAMQAAATEFSALVVMALAYGLLAEVLGIHWILGAFMAGLYFDRERIGDAVYEELNRVFEIIVRGLLAPLFFVGIGLQVDLRVIVDAPQWVLIITGVAFVTKFVGAGLPALMVGFGPRAAAVIGSGMTTRGAVELVVLGIVADSGAFEGNGMTGAGGNLFSALVIMAALNTLAAPMAVRALAKPLRDKSAER